MTHLQTDRLALAPLSSDHASAVQSLSEDYDVAAMVARIPHPVATDDDRYLVKVDSGDYIFAVIYEGGFIGSVGLSPLNDNDMELGYWIGRPWWNLGFATEAAREVVRFGFRDLGLSHIVSGHFNDNPASQRVLQKIGFQSTGLSRTQYNVARKITLTCVGYRLDRARALDLKLI